MVVPGSGGRGRELFAGYRLSLGEDKKVEELDGGDGGSTV